MTSSTSTNPRCYCRAPASFEILPEKLATIRTRDQIIRSAIVSHPNWLLHIYIIHALDDEPDQKLSASMLSTEKRSSLESWAGVKRQSPDDPSLAFALTVKRSRRNSLGLDVGNPESAILIMKSDLPARAPVLLQATNLVKVTKVIAQYLPGPQLLPLIYSGRHFLESLAPSTLDSMGFSTNRVTLDHAQTFIDGFRLANRCQSFRPLAVTAVSVRVNQPYQVSQFLALALFFDELPPGRVLERLSIQACSSVIQNANWQLLTRAISAKGACTNLTFFGPGSFETTNDADLPPLSIPNICFRNFDLSGFQTHHFLSNNQTTSLSLIHCAPYPIIDNLMIPSLISVKLTSDYAPSRIIPFLARHPSLNKVTIKGSQTSLLFAYLDRFRCVCTGSDGDETMTSDAEDATSSQRHHNKASPLRATYLKESAPTIAKSTWTRICEDASWDGCEDEQVIRDELEEDDDYEEDDEGRAIMRDKRGRIFYHDPAGTGRR
ncbi:hypothetical protein C8J56DRAFT_1037734 [Mycena floridula]|nr:hypothetical protein C8J56DRAFT_1037734 [Mycena floridula]